MLQPPRLSGKEQNEDMQTQGEAEGEVGLMAVGRRGDGGGGEVSSALTAERAGGASRVRPLGVVLL